MNTSTIKDLLTMKELQLRSPGDPASRRCPLSRYLAPKLSAASSRMRALWTSAVPQIPAILPGVPQRRAITIGLTPGQSTKAFSNAAGAVFPLSRTAAMKTASQSSSAAELMPASKVPSEQKILFPTGAPALGRT